MPEVEEVCNVHIGCKGGKVIYSKYSKQWLSTVAHTIDFVCSKILIYGLNHFHVFWVKQDSKELSPRPLANAPKTFNSKKTL